jgi:hypothetical protein
VTHALLAGTEPQVDHVATPPFRASRLKQLTVRDDTPSVRIKAGRKVAAGVFALAVFLMVTPAQGVADERDSRERLRVELSRLLHQLSEVGSEADRASATWMAARLAEIEARAAEEAARAAFEERVRHAYMAGPGRAIDFLLSSSDLHEFSARLPYASSSLTFGNVDASEIASRRRELEEVLREAEEGQRSFATAETRLGRIRVSIERRLAKAEASAPNDAGVLAEVRLERKRYAGTLDRVAGATRSIRRKRGEAMYAAALPFIGPRKDCSIPRGLRSTGDRIAGEASWYGEEFRGQPTASGAWYIPERFTVAHRTLPFGLYLLIRFRDRCVVAFLNDRGPYVDGRILDLSGGSARAVGLTGVQQVSATLLVRAR